MSSNEPPHNPGWGNDPGQPWQGPSQPQWQGPGTAGPYGSPQGPQQPQFSGPQGPWQQQPPKAPDDRPWFKMKRWWALGFVAILVVGGALGGTTEDTVTADRASDSTSESAAPSDEQSSDQPRRRGANNDQDEASQAPEPADADDSGAMKVQAAQLLSDYEGNEAAADAKYSGKLLEVTGNVSKVDTEFLDDSQYVVMLDNGDDFAFLTVNCNDVTADQAAEVQTGTTLTVRGMFDDGGDLGIELKDCEVL